MLGYTIGQPALNDFDIGRDHYLNRVDILPG
jgi:hypothetical protein